jgi:hypothetical protein
LVVVILSGPFDDPEHWLKLAQDTRATAQFLTDPFSKRTLLLIAQRYELMAERAKKTIEEGASLKQA